MLRKTLPATATEIPPKDHMNFRPFDCRKLWFVALPVFFLFGCALPTPPISAAQPKTNNPASAETKDRTSPSECAVTVIQDGKAVPSRMDGGAPSYSLRGAPFRIEVTSAMCDPSIGILLKPADFKFVADSAVIATTTGFEMAGNENGNDVLFLRSEDPRLIPPFQDMFDSVEKQYAALCKQLGKCPLKIRAIRSYWAFASDGAGTRRNFAHFNRLSREKPMLGTKGDVPVVVYTKINQSMTTPDDKNAFLKVLAVHAFVLRFF